MPLKINWNYQSLTKTNFSKKRQEIIKRHHAFAQKWQKNKDWLSDSVVLKRALIDYEKLQKYFADGAEEGYYYSLISHVKENDNKIRAGYNNVRQFGLQMNNKVLFFEHQLARISEATKNSFLKATELVEYKHYLERLFAQSKHLLSEPEEKILNLKTDVSYGNWVKMTASFLSAETVLFKNSAKKSEPKNFSEVMSLLNNQNKKTRDQANDALNQILLKHVKVGEAELNAILINKKIDDDLRGFTRPDYSRHLADDIETKVVDTMLTVVSKNFHLAQRYYKLKAKLLGVKQLKYHERNLSVGEFKGSFDFQQSCLMVKDVLGEIKPVYAQIFNRFVSSGQIDVYPKQGKGSGAFCASGLLSTPTYILLNHTNELKDVLTLAHEVGHGINNELMRTKQNSLNFGVSLATAEVASTFFEDFVLKKILLTANKNEQLTILMEKLNQDVSTIFRQVALYNFELELHASFRKTGYLSAQTIGKIFKKHMMAYMGGAVEQSTGSENWWLHWSHIRYFFYVYSYASGLLISKYFQKQVANNKQYTNNIDYFLSAGLAESPQKIFRNMGVNINDPTFWQQGLDQIKNLLDQAEKLALELKKV